MTPARRATLLLAAAAAVLAGAPARPAAVAPAPADVVATYADIALADYQDALDTARGLGAAVTALVFDPSEAALAAARAAFRDARAPYLQSEALRFGNPLVDAFVKQVNAWPIDPALIDAAGTGPGAEAGAAGGDIVGDARIALGGSMVDVAQITPDALAGLRDIAGEANGLSGYPVIEYLLWGEPADDTGPGTRPYTDYVVGEGCTGGHCDRRAAYLLAATDLLVADLEIMTANWQAIGPARIALLGGDRGLTAMLTGIGALSAELGDEIAASLLHHEAAAMQGRFSGDIAVALSSRVDGIGSVYDGDYTRIDGTAVRGASLSGLVAAIEPALDAAMRGRLDAARAAAEALGERAAAGEPYARMIAAGNAEGNAAVQALVDALAEQAAAVARIADALGLQAVGIEGSGSVS